MPSRALDSADIRSQSKYETVRKRGHFLASEPSQSDTPRLDIVMSTASAPRSRTQPYKVAAVLMSATALTFLTGCSSIGVGVGIPIGPFSIGVGVGSGGVNAGVSTGVGPVGVGVGVNQRGQVSAGAGVGTSTSIGNGNARVGVGVGTSTVIYDPINRR